MACRPLITAMGTPAAGLHALAGDDFVDGRMGLPTMMRCFSLVSGLLLSSEVTCGISEGFGCGTRPIYQ